MHKAGIPFYLVLPTVLLVVLAVRFQYLYIPVDIMQPFHLTGFLHHQGWAAALISIGLISVNTLVPFVPFLLLCGANVLVFGLIQGFLISWTGAVAGAITGFWLARVFFRGHFSTLGSQCKYSLVRAHQSGDHGFRLVFTARLIPFIPNSVVNYGAGISSISFRTYLWATLLGKVPVVAWASILSNDLALSNHPYRLTIMLLLSAAFAVAAMHIYQKL